MNYETIVFDLDGTLIDSTAVILAGYNHALNPFGITVNLNDIEAMRSHTTNELFMDRLKPNQAKIAVHALHEFSKQAAQHTVLLPGVENLLNNIVNMNIKMALWTGRDRDSALYILKHHRINQYFEKVVACCDVQKNKPSSEGLVLLANALKTNLSSMMHIGDHEHDLIGAKEVNVTAIHARWSHETASESTHPLSDFTFDSTHELDSWLRNLLK